MIRRGSTEPFWKTLMRWDPKEQDLLPVEVPCSVDWEVEISEYGDGRPDVELTILGCEEMGTGNEVALSEEDEDRLLERLKEEGELR